MPINRMINYDNPEVAWVTSEPGDATRYSYAILKDAARFRFAIIPADSTFKMPRVIEEWLAVKLHAATYNMTHKERAAALADVAEEHDCNPFTFAEIIMGIASLDSE